MKGNSRSSWPVRTTIALAGFLVLLVPSGCAYPERPTPTEVVAQQDHPPVAKPEPRSVENSTRPPVPTPPAEAMPATAPVAESPPAAADAPPAPKAEAPSTKAPPDAPKSAAPAAPAPKKDAKAAAAPAKPAAPQLDLVSLEQRLKDTEAIGFMTKLTLKNQVDDLLGRFEAHHEGTQKANLTELRQPFDLLIIKVLSLLQDRDAALAGAISTSREALWEVLSDPAKFRSFLTQTRS
jgi:hypothetical protein